MMNWTRISRSRDNSSAYSSGDSGDSSAKAERQSTDSAHQCQHLFRIQIRDQFFERAVKLASP